MKWVAYCNRCGSNWKTLPSQDDESLDATYEYCPECYTDMFLEAPRVQIQQTHTLIEIPSPPVKEKEKMTWQQKEKEREQLEAEAIGAYLEVYEKEGEAAARQAYFKKFCIDN